MSALAIGLIALAKSLLVLVALSLIAAVVGPVRLARVARRRRDGDAVKRQLRYAGHYSGWWQTASTLLPSGSRTKAPK